MKNIAIVVIFLLGITSNMFAGGPWPQPKGKGYFKLSEWWTIFDQHYTDTGLLDPNVTTGVFNTAFYGEYGVTNRLTTTLNANLFSRNYMNNLKSQTTDEVIVAGEGINTLGDIDVGIKYSLTPPGKIPLSISLVLGIPSGKTNGGTLGNLATGDGEFNQIIQIDSGFGFKLGENVSAYASGYAGFNNRTKQFSEELRFGLEAGIGLLKNKLWLTSKLNIVESLKNGATAETTTSTSIFANNTEFTSIAFEANIYVTKNIGISLGTATATRGEIIAAAPSYSIGVFYDMSK